MSSRTEQTTHAIVLAAGRGSRLGALTEAKPKGMVPLLGRPLLQWSADALRRAGITQLTHIGGYAADILRAEGFDVRENPRWAETNMVRSLMVAAPILAQHRCVISYSDIVYRAAHVRALMAADADIAITYDSAWYDLWKDRLDDPLSDAETFRAEQGWLKEIGAKPDALAQVQGQFMGLLHTTPEGWERIAAYLASCEDNVIDKLDMTRLLSLLLQRGEKIAAIEITGGWCEIDSPSDLALAERAARQGGWPHDWRDV